MSTIEFPFSDARVKKLVQSAFPGAKSRRTVKFIPREEYRVSDYWDGGSRNTPRFLDLNTYQVKSSECVSQRQTIANPFNLPIYTLTLTPGFVVVEHCFFCGKDMGYRVYYHPGLFIMQGMQLSELSGSDLLRATKLFGLNDVEPKQLSEGDKSNG